MSARARLAADAPAYRADDFASVLSMRKLRQDMGLGDFGADPQILLPGGTEVTDDGRTGTDPSPDAGFTTWQAVRGVPGDEQARYWVPRELLVVEGEEISVTGSAPSSGAGALVLFALLVWAAKEGM